MHPGWQGSNLSTFHSGAPRHADPKRITTYTSREFNQDSSGAKRAAEEGPVYITDGGRPAHVLLSIDAYRRLAGEESTIVDLIAMPATIDAELAFDPPPARLRFRSAELG